MFSSRNLILGAALIAIIWAGFVIGSRFYISNRIGVAKSEMIRGDYEGAIETLAAVDRFQPDNPRVQYEIAVAYRRKGDRDNFLAHLENAHRVGFNEPQKINLQAKLYDVQIGQNIDSIVEELKIAPEDVLSEDFVDQVCEAVASGYLVNSRFGEAEATLKDWIEHRNDAAPPHVMLGKIAQQRSDLARAEGHFKDAIERDPHNVDAVCGYVETINSGEDVSEAAGQFARNALQRCLEENPDHDRLLVVAASHAFKNGDIEATEKHAKRALEVRPRPESKVSALSLLGKIRLNAGDYEQAVKFLEGSVELNPINHDPYIQLALAYRGLGENELADEATETASRIKEKTDRIQEITSELATNPRDVEKILELAGILSTLEHESEAAQWWRVAIQLDPNNEQAKNRLAAFYRSQGRDDLAETTLNQNSKSNQMNQTDGEISNRKDGDNINRGEKTGDLPE